MQGQRDIGGTQMAHPARAEESSQNPCYNSKSTAKLASDTVHQLQPELTKSSFCFYCILEYKCCLQYAVCTYICTDVYHWLYCLISVNLAACKPHAEQMHQQWLDKGSASLFLSAMLGLEEPERRRRSNHGLWMWVTSVWFNRSEFKLTSLEPWSLLKVVS